MPIHKHEAIVARTETSIGDQDWIWTARNRARGGSASAHVRTAGERIRVLAVDESGIGYCQRRNRRPIGLAHVVGSRHQHRLGNRQLPVLKRQSIIARAQCPIGHRDRVRTAGDGTVGIGQAAQFRFARQKVRPIARQEAAVTHGKDRIGCAIGARSVIHRYREGSRAHRECPARKTEAVVHRAQRTGAYGNGIGSRTTIHIGGGAQVRSAGEHALSVIAEQTAIVGAERWIGHAVGSALVIGRDRQISQ